MHLIATKVCGKAQCAGDVPRSGQIYFGTVRVRAIKNGGTADDLHHVRAFEPPGQPASRISRFCRRILQDADFHQLAGVEGVARRCDGRIVDSFFADMKEWLQRMRECAQVRPLFGGKRVDGEREVVT